MSPPAREFFFVAIREIFAPALRRAGFKGSGQHFLRRSGEAINAVNIQGSKYGDECFLNLGLHYAFLPPCWGQVMPEGRGWKEIDCEFRWRLAPPAEYGRAWSYGSDASGARATVELLASSFARTVEPRFHQFLSPFTLAAAVPLELLATRNVSHLPFVTTDVRYALALARIHARADNLGEAKRFAQFGLQNLGGASMLRAPLEELASAT